MLYSSVNPPLSERSNDELCQLLGTYNDIGSYVLMIHNEIEKRGKIINHERCFSLEMTHRKNGLSFDKKIPNISSDTEKTDINVNYSVDLLSPLSP